MAQDCAYPRGAVKRIRLTNFMSFVGTVVIDAAPRVNVIEGPNGSGKSSVVTALCLGLGGNMKALGRQKRVEDLIRNGCRAFEVEVTLSGGADEPDVTVHRQTELGASGAPRRKRRRIGDKRAAAAGGSDGEEGSEDEGNDSDEPTGGGTSHTVWQVDGHVVKEARVRDLTRGMGIHFDNLCQFLPQERVNEFTNLGPPQLLESTEEAIGEGRLLAQHKELKQRSGALKGKREELQRVRDRLARVEAEQAANTAEYRRLQRRNDLQREVAQIGQKVLWVEKECFAERLRLARAKETVVQRKVDAARRRLGEAQVPLTARSEAVREAQVLATRLHQVVRLEDGKVAPGRNALTALAEQLTATADQLAGLKAKSNRWATEKSVISQNLARVRVERASQRTGLSAEQLSRLEQINEQMTAAAGEEGVLGLELAQKRDDIRRLDVQIRQLEDAQGRRLDRREQLLRKLDGVQLGSRELYEWIQKTRSEGGFKRRVLGPLLMEIKDVQDANWAAYLEQAVGAGVLAAVVTEDLADNNMVHDWLNARRDQADAQLGRGRGRTAFKNKVLMLPGPQRPVLHPLGEPSLYAAYGITHTLDQVFEATSDLVKAALVQISNIHQTYIGTAETDTAPVMNRLLRETPVCRIFTPRRATFASRSKYDPSHQYQNLETVRPARLLGHNVVAGDEAAEQQQLEARRQLRNVAMAEVAQLEAQVQASKAAVDALQEERRRLLIAQKQITDGVLRLEREEAEYARRLQLREQEGDPLAGAGALRQVLQAGAEKMMQQGSALEQLLRKLHQLNWDLAAAQLTAVTVKAGLAPLELAVRTAQGAVRAAEVELEAASSVVRQAEGRLREKEARVREELGADGPSQELRAAWAAWANDVEALEQQMAEKQAEMEQAQGAIRGDEAQVLQAWQRREAEMTQLRQSVATGSAELGALEADVAARMAAWLPELQQCMATISDSVQRHFAAIGCVGEVVLREAGDAFEDYAAEIRVQYRPSEPLRPLNRNHHSGGERSVATMVYLMALQGVTTTPFRVVDEINQGMDSRNERKVFNLLVECSSRPDTPQCFLLTPKLIANLRYNDHVRVQSMRYTSAGAFYVPPGFVAGLHQAAAEQDGGGADGDGAGGSGARNAGGQQRRQQRPGAAPTMGLGQIPWQTAKDTLFFGSDAAAPDGN